jgi:hypothetical protein
MLFGGNELKKSFEMNYLAFYNAENELILECKRTPIEPQKWQEAAFIGLRTRDRDATGERRRANGKRCYLEGTN